jgi:CMP-2-keto-3-deoxyoctulosonic acid synthetase
VRITMVEVDTAPPEVDTAEDLAEVRRLVEGAPG